MCRFKAQVASAYYSKKQVTAHPCVIHYDKEEEGPVLHKTDHLIGRDFTQATNHHCLCEVTDGVAPGQPAPDHPGPLPVRLTFKSVQECIYVPCRPQPPGHLQCEGDMELL